MLYFFLGVLLYFFGVVLYFYIFIYFFYFFLFLFFFYFFFLCCAGCCAGAVCEVHGVLSVEPARVPGPAPQQELCAQPLLSVWLPALRQAGVPPLPHAGPHPAPCDPVCCGPVTGCRQKGQGWYFYSTCHLFLRSVQYMPFIFKVYPHCHARSVPACS